MDDQPRIDYIEQHLRWLLKAMESGCQRGRLLPVEPAGSVLLDQWPCNKRYGFFYVDFETQKRTPKASAYWV